MRDARTGFLVGLAILGFVALDGLPYILASLAKELRVDPWMTPGAFLGVADLPGYWISSLLEALGGKKVKHIPWIAVILSFGILAHWIGGWRLTATVVLCLGYLAFTGLWRESMKTFSLVMVAVPLAAALGLWLGVLVTRSKTAELIFTPMFDVMQATPHLAYLVPVVVMFGAGQVPALIATVIFAMPPMARCTILGIQTVPSDVVEAGRMSGCTPSQLLWKVQLPASQRTLLLGLNQVIMQTLAMVVIASLVGAAGLGHKLLFSLQQLKLGFATMQGVAIVLMAVVLDRMTQAYAERSTDYAHHDRPSFWLDRGHLVVFVVVAIGAVLAASVRDRTSLRLDWLRLRAKHAVAQQGVFPGGPQRRAGIRQSDQGIHVLVDRLHPTGSGLDHRDDLDSDPRVLSVDPLDSSGGGRRLLGLPTGRLVPRGVDEWIALCADRHDRQLGTGADDILLRVDGHDPLRRDRRDGWRGGDPRHAVADAAHHVRRRLSAFSCSASSGRSSATPALG